MSAADGTARPCSMREIFEPCRSISRPSSRAVSPASIRSSRRRIPRAWRPCWTLDDGEDTKACSVRPIVLVRGSALPHRLEGRGTQLHYRRIGDRLVGGHLALAGKVVD